MSAKLSFPLTRDYVRSAPLHALRDALKVWLQEANPICLMHPHGFYVVLLNRNETEEWRFHYWPKGPRTTLGMPAFIHTHDRHIESRVLQGQLTNILHEISEIPTGGQPLYEVIYEGDRYAPTTSNLLRRTTTRVKTTLKQRNTITCGDTYRIERHTYHEAVVSEQIATCTLVCMHGQSPGGVKVVGLDGHPETITFQRAEHRAQIFTEHLFL